MPALGKEEKKVGGFSSGGPNYEDDFFLIPVLFSLSQPLNQQ
jgi:hypothetical protein